MLEESGDLWKFHERGEWIAITTNGDVRHDGQCVMGRGTALQAKQRYPELPLMLGDLIRIRGNQINAIPGFRIISYPVKHHWYDKACPGLIGKSAVQLMQYLDAFPEVFRVYMPRPGCGNGQLEWLQVQHLIRPVLDHRVTVVEYAHAA